MVSSCDEAYLFFPSCLWSHRSLAETLKQFVCHDSYLKTRQSQMVSEKKGAIEETGSLLCVTDFCFMLPLS